MLAQLLKEAGDLEASKPLMEQTVEYSLAVFGEEHVVSFQAVHNLAGLHFDLGELDEAERLERKALELAANIIPPEHPINAALFEILSGILAASGRMDEAIEAQTQSCSIRQGAFGEEHVLTIQAHFLLGRLLAEKGDMEAARDEFELARQSAANVPAIQSHFMLLICEDLVLAHRSLGEEAAAVTIESSMQALLPNEED